MKPVASHPGKEIGVPPPVNRHITNVYYTNNEFYTFLLFARRQSFIHIQIYSVKMLINVTTKKSVLE